MVSSTVENANGSVEPAVLELLSQRQYLRPHSGIARVLSEVGEQMGLARADFVVMSFRAGLSPDQPIGRATRATLQVLARQMSGVACN
jgi:hypothetical protein